MSKGTRWAGHAPRMGQLGNDGTLRQRLTEHHAMNTYGGVEV